MKNITYTWADFDADTQALALKISLTEWKPQVVVSLNPQSAVLALKLANLLNLPITNLNCIDDETWETCCWLAEDIFGYPENPVQNALVVQINNHDGELIDSFKQDLQDACLPNDAKWNTIWENNVKFVALWENSNTAKPLDFTVREYNPEFVSSITLPWNTCLNIKDN